MIPTHILLIQCLLALFYIWLTIQPQSTFRHIIAVGFGLLAVSLRCLIDVDAVMDFSAYFDNFREVKYGTGPGGSIVEPYIVAVYRLALLCVRNDDLGQIKSIYYLHFTIVTGFFVWLAYLREVTFESKLILFFSFYPWMAFVGLRGGMAYTASCFLFLAVANRRLRVTHWLIPLIHTCALPYVVAMKATVLKPLGRLVVVCTIVAVGFGINFTSLQHVNHFVSKYERYSETAHERTSANLLLFHVANILLLTYLSLINIRFRTNGAVLALICAYIIAYYLNPVMGVRLFPLVLIASMAQRIAFPRYQAITMVVCLAYLPVFFVRFDQFVLRW